MLVDGTVAGSTVEPSRAAVVGGTVVGGTVEPAMLVHVGQLALMLVVVVVVVGRPSKQTSAQPPSLSPVVS